jgi:hypothetical protein
VIEQDLRDKILENVELADLFSQAGVDPAADGAIAYNHMPENPPTTRIWFVRNTTDHDRLLGGKSALQHAFFDVECASTTLDTAMLMAKTFEDVFPIFRGPMGQTWVQACDVSEQSDDYVYHHDYADEGLAVAPLQLHVML